MELELRKLSSCFMSASFDVNKFVAALPGGFAVGFVTVQENCCIFLRKNYCLIPERRLDKFMKVLQCLSNNMILSEDEKKSETIAWEEISIGTKGNKLQCQMKNQFDFSFDFNISNFLAFLIGLRKVCCWIVGPSKIEFEIMDFFIRHTKNNLVEFPKIGEMEEDIKTVLEEQEYSAETKFFLTHFLLNHHCLLEFQYNLVCLTTKS